MTAETLDISRPKPPRSTLVLLVAIACCGPLAIDIYLPSLPNLAETFQTNVGAVQLTMSIYLAGLALGQLLVVLLVPIFAGFLFGCAVVFPGTLSGVVDPFPQMAGAASGLMGFIQMIAGAMASFGVAQLFNGTALPMAISLMIGTWGAILIFSYLRQRVHRRPA